MSEAQVCPRCRIRMPAGAPAGLCPKCLLAAGLEDDRSAASRTESPAAAVMGLLFVPPRPEELAKYFPHLEIIDLIGKGGMGAVYKARQPHLDRLVAIKILPPEVGQDPAFAERFVREARALARLNHPNIVNVFDFGQTGGLYYFIMEYVDGANLRTLIQHGQLESKQALAIVPQICEALQFAHDEGIVHRDIKPENILVDKRGRVKIADFGLAKLFGAAGIEGPLTATHQVMGTMHYMAPEQLQGARRVDHRADIYSLGVVFYEMLTGNLPLGRFDPPSRKAHIDARLDEVVLRSLEAEPDRRYQHASEVRTDLQSLAIPPTIVTPPPVRTSPVAQAGLANTSVQAPLIGIAFVFLMSGLSLFAGLTVAPIGNPFLVIGEVIFFPALLTALACSILLAFVPPLRRFVASLQRDLSLHPTASAKLRAAACIFIALSISVIIVAGLGESIFAHAHLAHPDALSVLLVTATVANVVISFVAVAALIALGPNALGGDEFTDSGMYGTDAPSYPYYPPTSDEGLRIQLRVPSTLLLLSSILDFIGLMAMLFGGIHAARTVGPMTSFLEVVIVGVLFIRSSLCFVIGFGALRMRRLQNYELARAACIFASIPFSAGWIFGLIAAVWLMCKLRRPEFIDGFQRHAAKRTDLKLSTGLKLLLLLPTIFVSCLTILLILWTSRAQHRGGAVPTTLSASPIFPKSDPQQQWVRWTDGLPNFGWAITASLNLGPEREAAINEKLQAIFKKYIDIEAKHTTRSTTETGRQIVKIEPFTEEVRLLESELWSELDPLLISDDERRQARNIIRPVLHQWIFAFHAGLELKMWRSGTFYAWSYTQVVILNQPNEITSSVVSESEDAALPPEIQRFWQEQ